MFSHFQHTHRWKRGALFFLQLFQFCHYLISLQNETRAHTHARRHMNGRTVHMHVSTQAHPQRGAQKWLLKEVDTNLARGDNAIIS